MVLDLLSLGTRFRADPYFCPLSWKKGLCAQILGQGLDLLANSGVISVGKLTSGMNHRSGSALIFYRLGCIMLSSSAGVDLIGCLEET